MSKTLRDYWLSFLLWTGLESQSAPAAPPPLTAKKGPGPKYDYSSIGKGEPDILDLVPLALDSGLTVYVTPVPMYRMNNGIPTHIPMTALGQSEYGKSKKLLCVTDKVLDTMFTKGGYIRPQTDFYDPAGDMQSPGLVIEKAVRVSRAMAKAGLTSKDVVVNVSKAWILSNANKPGPGKKPGVENAGVNRGYWMSPTDKLPIQKYGVAHTNTYTDLAQCAFFMSEDTSQGDARGIMTDPKRFNLITNESEPIWRTYYQ